MIIPVNIRVAIVEDDPIVYDCWARSMADEVGVEGDDARRAFVRGYKPVITALIARSTTMVAVSRKDPLRVLGWICVEIPDVLHFVFTKRAFRQGGIARQLIERSQLPRDVRASHSTSWGMPRLERLFASIHHDPTLGLPR